MKRRTKKEAFSCNQTVRLFRPGVGYLYGSRSDDLSDSRLVIAISDAYQSKLNAFSPVGLSTIGKVFCSGDNLLPISGSDETPH